MGKSMFMDSGRRKYTIADYDTWLDGFRCELFDGTIYLDGPYYGEPLTATEMWDSQKTIGTVNMNIEDKIIIKEVTLEGRRFVDVRTFYPDDTGELKPANGIAIPAESFDEVLEILNGITRSKR